MKTIALLLLSFLIISSSFGQSKKESDAKLLQLEEKTKALENEIANIKTTLTNTSTTLSLVSKSNLDLEKLVKEQTVLIDKLSKQNDSLLSAFSVKKDLDFVTNPKNEEDSIMWLIQSYFGSKKWDDRLAYVLNPQAMKPLMQSHYMDNYESSTVKKGSISIQGANFASDASFKVVIGGYTIVYCKKTSTGFSIDWEATAGYNPMSMKTFKANSSTQAAEFRVKASIGTYYNYNYGDAKNTHWNVSVVDNAGNHISGCYISKSSAEGKKIYEILKDGNTHDLILEIKMDYSADDSGHIALITRLVQKGWSK